MPFPISHYRWLEEHFDTFTERMGVEGSCRGLISAAGDKCYGYQRKWEQAGILFEHGVAVYLLTHLNPWGHEIPHSGDDWVDPGEWVVDNFHRFADHLPPAYDRSSDED